ncbi:hypothetical protein A5641_26145 [Mycobacterium sp. 1554424.7]|nr:hypothetical protein A5641_26145 [Mycobacterium sp. 1554424.7]
MTITPFRFLGTGRGKLVEQLSIPGANSQSFMWATICEMDRLGQHPIYGGAFLTIQQIVPRDDEAVNVDFWIDNVPDDINYRIEVYHDDFLADTRPVFGLLGPVVRGRGHQRVTIRHPAIQNHTDLWASVCEMDATGQRPLFGGARLTVQQIVPDPDNSGVDVGVWIDNVPVDINYRVTVFGLGQAA